MEPPKWPAELPQLLAARGAELDDLELDVDELCAPVWRYLQETGATSLGEQHEIPVTWAPAADRFVLGEYQWRCAVEYLDSADARRLAQVQAQKEAERQQVSPPPTTAYARYVCEEAKEKVRRYFANRLAPGGDGPLAAAHGDHRAAARKTTNVIVCRLARKYVRDGGTAPPDTGEGTDGIALGYDEAGPIFGAAVDRSPPRVPVARAIAPELRRPAIATLNEYLLRTVPALHGRSQPQEVRLVAAAMALLSADPRHLPPLPPRVARGTHADDVLLLQALAVAAPGFFWPSETNGGGNVFEVRRYRYVGLLRDLLASVLPAAGLRGES